jgi:hypothetical protein
MPPLPVGRRHGDRPKSQGVLVVSLNTNWPAGSYDTHHDNAQRKRDPIWPSIGNYPRIAASEGRQSVPRVTIARRE